MIQRQVYIIIDNGSDLQSIDRNACSIQRKHYCKEEFGKNGYVDHYWTTFTSTSELKIDWWLSLAHKVLSIHILLKDWLFT